IIGVLTKLGEPRLLAEQYRQKPRYLISPAMFDGYISVLKTVTAVVAGVLAFIGAFTAFSSGSLCIVLLSAFGMAFEGALQAALWVTAAFVIAEKCGYKKEPWKPADLPPLASQNSRNIPRSSSIVGIILTVFFTGLFVMMILRRVGVRICPRFANHQPAFTGGAPQANPVSDCIRRAGAADERLKAVLGEVDSAPLRRERHKQHRMPEPCYIYPALA
ncbi:MAG: hypothetical protein FWH06_03420, partial [Oscillospiraceae bacterium]|nr:hypothetical protein [Oscillospiraceae bacterium]